MSTNPRPHPLPRAKRPLWRVILGSLLLFVGGVIALGVLTMIPNGSFAEAENSAELIGMLLGALCCVGLPLLGGILLVAWPVRRP